MHGLIEMQLNTRIHPQYKSETRDGMNEHQAMITYGLLDVYDVVDA